jgi:hypothetical protein
MTGEEKYEIIERVGRLPAAEQVALIEGLLRGLRNALTDHAAKERDLESMANDPDIQRVLRNEDLVDKHAAG